VAAQAATVTGAVRVSGTRGPRAATVVTVDVPVCGERIADESLLVDARGGLANAVVVLRPSPSRPADAVPPGSAVLVDNVACRFVPRVQIVRRGQAVRVRNTDPVLHNARASLPGPPEIAVANLALARAGQTMDLTRRLDARLPAAPAEATVRLGCDVHPWMRGWLVIVDHSYAAVTDAMGGYTIRDVPAGAYTLAIWHEALGRTERPLAVPPGGTVRADATLPGS